MKYYYNKLVRDKIVQNINNKGCKSEFKILNEEEYKKELNKNLLEETNEVIDDHSAEEIGDLLEVILAVMKEYNISEDEIKIQMEQKRKTKGAFEDKIYLISVEEQIRRLY